MPTQQSNAVCSTNNPVTLRALNERNHQFWSDQRELTDKWILDEAILKIALKGMRSEATRGVSIKTQKPLEQALTDAAPTRSILQTGLAQKGGRAPKATLFRV